MGQKPCLFNRTHGTLIRPNNAPQLIALWKKKIGGMRNFILKELCHEIQAN